MSFSGHFNATYRWHQINDSGQQIGLEHLHVNSCDNNIIISSTVIGSHGKTAFGAKYTIICFPDWRVRAFNLENTQGQNLAMNADGEGNWFNQNGANLAKFSGIIDIDFSATAFTNTLPIRRMTNHKPDHSQRFRMLYIPFDTFQPEIIKQQYSCLIPYQKYGYESHHRNFATSLQVDKNAIVFDYPSQFIREFTKETQ